MDPLAAYSRPKPPSAVAPGAGAWHPGTELGRLLRTGFLVSLALLVLWLTWSVWLIIFAGVLLAVTLRAVADWLHRLVGLSLMWSLVAAIAGVPLLGSVAGYLLAPIADARLAELLKRILPAVHRLRGELVQSALGRSVLSAIDWGRGGAGSQHVFGLATMGFHVLVG